MTQVECLQREELQNAAIKATDQLVDVITDDSGWESRLKQIDRLTVAMLKVERAILAL